MSGEWCVVVLRHRAGWTITPKRPNLVCGFMEAKKRMTEVNPRAEYFTG